MNNMMKKILKLIGKVIVVFAVSVIVVNVLAPIFQKDVTDQYKEKIAQTEFQSDQPGTERIRCIDDNEEALLWRLRMIGAAQESIELSTFDFRTDEGGLDVMAALYDAADRGVKVGILIDGIYQPIFLRNSNKSFSTLCAHENIDVKFYNPITLNNIYHVNYRMHDKYILVDGRMYLLGGRNTTDIFLGELHKGSNIDREVLVYNTENEKGESYQQLENYFEQIWNEKCAKLVEPSVKEKVCTAQSEAFQNRYQTLMEKYGDFTQYDAWTEGTYAANKITLLSNGTSAGGKGPGVLYAIEQLAAKGHEVSIQTPYIICNRYMYLALSHIGENADLKIFINAVENGTNPWGCTDYLNNKSKILATGADIYEVMNDYALHTKAVLVDDNLSIIGSYNLDMRSTYLDTELMLVVDSRELNAQIKEQLEHYKEESIEVLPDGTETVNPLYREQKLNVMKKISYGALRILTIPFRHLL